MKKHVLSTGNLVVACLLLIVILSVSACKTTTPVAGDRIGNIAPDITASDAVGQMQSLNALRGKLVLVEFWDSNNTAARKNHYEMERMYVKYRDKELDGGNGFAIYSISIDKDPEVWKKAIAADGIHFTAMVNDPQAWNSKAVLDYNIATLPKYFLIDKNGIILNHNILIPDLEKILQEQED